VDKGKRAALAGVVLLLAGVSFLMHAQGALNWAPYTWNFEPFNVDGAPMRLWNWRDPQFARGPWITPEHKSLLNLTGGVVPADVKLYDSGMVVRFQAGSCLDPSVLRSGWSGLETWGVWSDGPEAQVMLDPKPALGGTGELLLLLRATAFVSPRHPRQIVDVLVNDTRVALWTFNHGDGHLERRVRLPAAVVKFPLAVTFQLPNSVSPAQLGGSADRRRLGIGLATLRLVPVS